MVSAGLMLVMFNSNAIVWSFTKALRARKSYRAVIRTAIAYPLRSRLRTALSIFIFGLVIFTVTTLSVMTAVLDHGIPKLAAETSGGYDIIAFTAPHTPLEGDLWELTNTTSAFMEGRNITSVLPLATGSGMMGTTATDSSGDPMFNSMPYSVVGFDGRCSLRANTGWRNGTGIRSLQRKRSGKAYWTIPAGHSGREHAQQRDGPVRRRPSCEDRDVLTLTTMNGPHSFTVVG